MYESFYGGKQGRSYQIVQHFDSIYDMVQNFEKGNAYADVAFDEYVIIDTILNKNEKSNPENGIIYRRGYNYNEGWSNVPGSISNNANSISQEMTTSILLPEISTNELYSIVWTTNGMTVTNSAGNIVTNYSTMTTPINVPFFYNFSYKWVTEIVNNKPTSVIIVQKNDFNYDRWNSVWHSYVTQPGGGAIYIGQIVGAQGDSPAIELIDWDTYQNYTENNLESIQNHFIITPKKGYDSTQKHNNAGYNKDGYDKNGFHDVIQYGHCTLRDAQGNVTGAYLAFDFPYTVFKFEAHGISAYPPSDLSPVAGVYTDSDGTTYKYYDQTKLWEYDNLVTENADSKTHPFYKHYDIKIPKGIHGQNISQLQILHKIPNSTDYNDIYDSNGEYRSDVRKKDINGQDIVDENGNYVLDPQYANQFLTYKTLNFDEQEQGKESTSINIAPYKVLTSTETTTVIEPPEAQSEESNYQHSLPKEIVFNYSYGSKTTVKYQVIERVWVQQDDSDDPVYGTDEHGLQDSHLYVLYSTEDRPRDLGLIKFVDNIWVQDSTDETRMDADSNILTENCVYLQLTGEDRPRYLGLIKRVDDIWIQADNDTAHPSNRKINANQDTVKKDYIYTQLTNEEYPHELGFIRKITSVSKDPTDNKIYVNYNYSATGQNENIDDTREELPVAEISKVTFNGDLFLIQFKNVPENFEQNYLYQGEYWVNLGTTVKGYHVLTEFNTLDDLKSQYPTGLGYDETTENRAGWLVTVGHDQAIVIRKVIDPNTGAIQKFSVNSADATCEYDEVNQTYNIILPSGSQYSDTTNLEVEPPVGSKLYGFDYRKQAWWGVADVSAGAVKPEYSILVAPADANNLPDTEDSNQLNVNGIWLVEIE